MGIDNAFEELSSAIMFDWRARMFNDNKWFSNQVPEQTQHMSSVSNYDRVDSPLGAAALTMPFADFGNSPRSRLFSDRLPSADSSNDPDGPAMDNGNCQSPGLDSLYSDPTALGTPNSFISDQFPGSPDMFTGRERLISTGSAYTYSPYSPSLEEPFTLGQPCTNGAIALGRQTSLAMVEEVLGLSEDCNQTMTFTQEEDSPMPDCDDDSMLPSYPSPSFIAHFNASTDPTHLVIFQDEEIVAKQHNVNVPSMLQYGGSPTSESNEASSTNCNDGSNDVGTQPASEEPASTCTPDVSVALLAPPATMTRQGSSFSDLITDSLPTNSLDASALMQDFLDTVPSQSTTTQPTFSTLNVEILSIGSVPQTAEVVQTAEHPVISPSSSGNEVVLQTDEHPKPTTSSFSGEKDAVTARRERNNAACRVSRKRRKEKNLELGGKVAQFTEENASLRIQIENLEVECKRVKATILTAMTNNNNQR